MPIDELPIYPTPKQASYAAHNGNHHSSSSGRKLKSSSHQKSYKPSKSGHYQHLQPQHTASHHSSHSQHPSGHYQAPPPSQQSYYQPQAYQPPPPQPQPQPQPPQVTGHGPQMGRPTYNQPQVAPTPQQYYHQSPPAPTAAPVPVPAPTPPQQPMYHQSSSHHQPSSHHQQYAPPPPSTSHHQMPQAQSPRKVYQTVEATSGHNRPSPSHEYSHHSLPQVPMKKPPPSSNSIGQMQPHMRSKESLHEKPLSSKQKLEIELRSVFDKVDINHSGRISKDELSNALLNFDHTRFQDSTIRLMINLFSNAHNGSSKHLNFDQFVSLWKYLSAYKKLFIQADTNNSGDISFGEFQKILEQIGYKLNIDLVLHLFQRFSYKDYETNDSAAIGKLKFDRFIELLVYLRKLTDVFKKYDKDLSGVATINFLDFLFEVSNLS